MNAVVGSHDILVITFDTLRYDVAQAVWKQGRSPTLLSVPLLSQSFVLSMAQPMAKMDILGTDWLTPQYGLFPMQKR